MVDAEAQLEATFQFYCEYAMAVETSPGVAAIAGLFMQRLRGSDAFTIYAESSSSPFVTLKAAIYRASHDNVMPDTSEIKRFVKAGIAVVGAERAGSRIIRVPFDLHHPVWVADPEFCPDDHIYCAELPLPGNRAQLCTFLSELMSKPLVPDRPPWEIWLVAGLGNGQFAIVLKVHHALADGKTLAALIERCHVGVTTEAVAKAGVAKEAIPGRSRLISDAIIDLARSFTRELPRFYRHLKQYRQVSPVVDRVSEDNLAPFSAPYTLFNEKGGSARIYRYETFSLAEFKCLGKIFDCTVNTLVMGVCSEALRRYLLELDALPQEPLIAVMPLSDQGGANLKTLLNSHIHNNHLAAVTLPLYQGVDDFEQRLRAIKRSSRAAIETVLLSSGRRFENYFDFVPGALVRLINTLMERRQEKKKNPYANVAISNVPGPREVLYAVEGRLEMVELISTGNLTDTVNLNITVWSYVDNLCFSFYSRKGVLPEPDKINTHLKIVLEELRSRYLTENASLRSVARNS